MYLVRSSVSAGSESVPEPNAVLWSDVYILKRLGEKEPLAGDQAALRGPVLLLGFEVLAGCPRCLPKECCKDQVWIRDRRAKTIGGPSFDPFTLPRRPRRWLETRFLNAVAGVQTPSVQPFIWTPNLPYSHN